MSTEMNQIAPTPTTAQYNRRGLFRIGGLTAAGAVALAAMLCLSAAAEEMSLVMTRSARSPLLPGVPTMAEAGFPAVDAALINAVIAPAGLPEAIVATVTYWLASIIEAPGGT